MAEKNKETVNCLCGTKPELVSKPCVMSKDTFYLYKCPNCKRESECSWPKDSPWLIGSWNNTIKIAKEYVGYGKKT